MANDQITGNVVGKIKFTIDKASWNNLETFQKKLTSIKKQMSNLDKTINVNAVVKSVEKVAKAQIQATEKVARVQKKAAKEGVGLEFGKATGSNREYAAWWKDTLAIQDKGLKESIRQQKNHIRQQQQMVKQANARAGMAGRLSWMFPSGGVSNKASGTLFAQMLRDEEKAGKAVKHTGVVNSPSGVGLEFGKATGADRTYAAWWNDALKAEEKALKDYDKRRERVLSTRAKLNAARRKRKSKAIDASSMFEQRVNAFMTVKENQIRNEAIRKGYAGTQQEADNLARLHKARVDNFNAVYGNIGQFRANLNGVVNGMHTVQRAAAANKVTFASLRGELVQLTAAYGAFAVAQNIVQTGFAFEGLRASAKVFAKDEDGVAEHMNFIRDQAYRLGVDLQTATKEFTKFSIATKSTLSKKDQRELFVGISEYARVMGASQSDYERAFRAVQQIASKGQLYKEELTGQLGEALGGSVDAMMRAAGYSDTKTFFKAVEDGKIMANDVLPKFGKELQKMAKEGGALDAVMGKTQANFSRFMNAVTEAKLAIYGGGMDNGLAYMFSGLSGILEDLKPVLKVVGALFKGFVTILSTGLRLVLAPINMVIEGISELWGLLGGGDRGTQFFWSVVGAGGTLMLLLSRFKMLREFVFGVNTQLLVMLGTMARIVAPLLVIEDVWTSMQGGRSVTGAGGSFSATGIFGENSITKFLDRPLNSFFANDTNVTISVKGDEAAKFIQATVDKSNQSKNAVAQTELAQ